MIYKLFVTLEHANFKDPLEKEFLYQGDCFDDIVDQIRLSSTDLPDRNLEHLTQYHRTAFRDVHGVKHSWKLKKMKDLGNSDTD